MAKFVRTASVYVEGADSPSGADSIVEDANRILEEQGTYIRLPDEDSEYKWEEC